MNNYLWLIKREFWENRAIWVIPSVIGVVLILLALFGRTQFTDLNAPQTLQQSHVVGQVLLSAFGATFFVVMSIYSSWYLLDCLYGDRKDRSVLFWKSLPISDTTTVLSKLLVALIVIPLVYFMAADVTTLLVAFVVSVRASAALGGAMWHADLWLQLQVLWLYVIITSAIWFLPVAAWLMVISAWAKRAVMLWTVLPPLALYLGERWIFGTRFVATVLHDRLLGYARQAFHSGAGASFWVTTSFDNDQVTTPSNMWSFMDPATFFSSPQTWIGVAVGAALVAGAIQLRLRRTEI
jgi:ABC-2 type transport system permease protein